MKLKQILMPTKVATYGMTVREVFAECGRANIPALPFCTKSGRIAGRVTLKNIMKCSCLPDYAPAIKALAIMEQNDTSYLFVVDDGQYQGAVTIQCLAKMLIRLDQC